MAWNDELTGGAFDVAASTASRLRVRAGPGTGKTFAMMRRVARILEEGVLPTAVLVSTFTRVAAADLKTALEYLQVPGADLVKAITIHGLCFSMLQRHEVLQTTGRVARPILDFELRFLLEDLPNNNFGTIPQKRKRIKAFESAWARLQTDTPGWALDPVDRAFEKALLEWLKFHQAMLIGELVPVALRYLRDNPAAQELHDFKNILVDEYQDLNAAEQEVVDLLASNAELTIVGDEDQSIYSFKHAYPIGIGAFAQKHQGTQDATLDVCRRCPALVVALANELIRKNQRDNPKQLLPHSKEAGEVHIVQWRSTEEEAEGLAHLIHSRIAKGTQPGKVLVLSPTRKLGYSVREALTAKGIQAHSFFREQTLDGDPSNIQASRGQQAMTLLTLAANPTDAVALRCWCGFGSHGLRQPIWSKVRELCGITNRSLSEILDDIRDGVIPLPHSRSLRERLVALQEYLAELTGLEGQKLIEKIFHDEEALDVIRGLGIGALTDCDASTVLDSVRTSITQPELPTDVDYVRVMSLHKSKGLTADLVIVTGCMEGLIPRIDPDLSENEQEAALQEQRRLFYVAMTRARKTLILSSATALNRPEAYRQRFSVPRRPGQVPTIASRFIAELGPTRPAPVIGSTLLEEMA